MMLPEMMYLTLTSIIGGKDSRDMRMPRYVVPQKKNTATKAR